MTTWWERAIAQTPGLLDSPQAQTFLHAVHLRKVGRVARFWAAKEPLAPRKEERKKVRSRDGGCCARPFISIGDQMACFVQLSRSLSVSR